MIVIMGTRRCRIEIHPVSSQRWKDLTELFGQRGACGGCWCMLWRLTRKRFEEQKGPGNRRALKRLVDKGPAPGLLAYADHEPVGWVAVAPRQDFSALARSRVLAPVDDAPVWSIVCLFVRKDQRRRGVSVRLLEAAAAFAREHGARIIEGYPSEPRKGSIPDVFAYMGLPSAFEKAGFREVLRRSEIRPIMRRKLRPRP